VPVEDTPLDFRQMLPIGARLSSAFQLNKGAGDRTALTARGYDPRTGRLIDCLTTEPAVQVYTGNGMKGSVVGSSGTTYRQTEACILEKQHFPDSPNESNFPTTALSRGRSPARRQYSGLLRIRHCRHCRAECRHSQSNSVDG